MALKITNLSPDRLEVLSDEELNELKGGDDVATSSDDDVVTTVVTTIVSVLSNNSIFSNNTFNFNVGFPVGGFGFPTFS